MPLAPNTKLASDVIARIKRQFGDESGAQITDADILTWINDGQLEIARKNKVIKTIATTPSIVGTPSYTFPAVKIISVEQVYFANNPIPYRSFNEVSELLINSADAASIQGDPTCWYEWDDAIYFYPTPNSVQTITIYVTIYPTPVVSTSDPLSLPDLYYETLIQFCLAQAYEFDDDAQRSSGKLSQVNNELGLLAQNEDGYNAQYYPTITVLVDDL